MCASVTPGFLDIYSEISFLSPRCFLPAQLGSGQSTAVLTPGWVRDPSGAVGIVPRSQSAMRPLASSRRHDKTKKATTNHNLPPGDTKYFRRRKASLKDESRV